MGVSCFWYEIWNYAYDLCCDIWVIGTSFLGLFTELIFPDEIMFWSCSYMSLFRNNANSCMLLLFVGELPSLLASAKKLIFTSHMNVYKNIFPNSFLLQSSSYFSFLWFENWCLFHIRMRQKVREDCYIKVLRKCLSSLSRLVYGALYTF